MGVGDCDVAERRGEEGRAPQLRKNPRKETAEPRKDTIPAHFPVWVGVLAWAPSVIVGPSCVTPCADGGVSCCSEGPLRIIARRTSQVRDGGIFLKSPPSLSCAVATRLRNFFSFAAALALSILPCEAKSLGDLHRLENRKNLRVRIPMATA